jgi:hypothetical protein
VAGGGRHTARHLDESGYGMTTFADPSPLEDQIAQWRTYLLRHRAIHAPDVEEL